MSTGTSATSQTIGSHKECVDGPGPEELSCHSTDYFDLAKRCAMISAILPDPRSFILSLIHF